MMAMKTISTHRGLPADLDAGLRRGHIPALDAMRAFSAFLVVFYHGGLEWVPGGLGVLAFFVLSGFLITWLLLKERAKYGQVSLRLFYARRSLRIFPAFYGYWLLVVGGLWFFGKRLVWPQAWASFFYVNNYYQAVTGDPNTALSHTWSLGVEEQFYLLWPALFLQLSTDLRKAGRVLIVLIVAVWLHRVVLKLVFGVGQGYFYEAFDTRADSLMVGCLLAIVLREADRSWVLDAAGWLTNHAAKPLLPLAGLVLSTAIAARVPGYRDLVGFVVDPVLVAVLIVQWITLSLHGRWWQWLNQPWLCHLGALSYSIYLYQQIVPGFAGKLARGTASPLYWVLTIGGVIAAASISYHFVEKPFLRWKDKLTRS